MLSFDKCVQNGLVLLCIFAVTPCAGVWIEIAMDGAYKTIGDVTPCAGVWIEIDRMCRKVTNNKVTPCAGVWIEILTPRSLIVITGRHSLCGSVD